MRLKPAKCQQIPCSDGRNAGQARAELARSKVPQALMSPKSLRSPITHCAGVDSAARSEDLEDFALHHRRDFDIAHVGLDLDGENEGEGQQKYGPWPCRHACPSLSYKVVSHLERKQTEGSFSWSPDSRPILHRFTTLCPLHLTGNKTNNVISTSFIMSFGTKAKLQSGDEIP